MKADLYTAQARTAGADGLAHRTAAGFVVLTSTDGNAMIDLIDTKQNEADLIDQVVGRAHESGPAAFAMLFTAGGELYLIASGSATASISTTTGQFSIGATGDQVLVYPINGGMGETTAAITLQVEATDDSQSGGARSDLQGGTVSADSIEIAIGSAALHRLTADMPKYQAPIAEADDAADEPSDDADEIAAPDIDEPAAAQAAEDPGEPDASPPAHALQGGAADVEEPDVEPVAIVPPRDDDSSLLGDDSVPEAAEIPHPPTPAATPDSPAPATALVPEPPMPAAAPKPAPATALVPEPPMPAATPEAPAPANALVPEPPMPAAAPEPAPAPQPAAIPDPPVPAPAEAVAAPEPAAIPDPPVPAPPVPAPPAAAPVPAPPAPAPEPVAAAESTPVPAPPIDAAAASVGPAMVLGVACSQHHHNHPDAVYCSQCGTKMGVHHTTVLINGPRPPLGVLVVDDGTTYSLSQDLVIGREPTTHDDVVAGTASPMILTDDTLSLSRKHARIVLDEWSVLVQDLGSSNGTYLSRAGHAENWTRLAPSSTSGLEPGDRLRVGGRIIQVELHHVR